MNLTKNAIINAFWQLLDEKPYNKITVKDITDRCQINRNTFYYHFRDIPDLLNTIVTEDADRVIRANSRFGSPLDCLRPLVKNCEQRKKAILHIYRSIHQEVFLKELDRILLYVITQYVDAYTKDSEISPDNKRQLIWFYKCSLTGVLLDWLNDGMNYDLLSAFFHLHRLLNDPDNRLLLKTDGDGAPE